MRAIPRTPIGFLLGLIFLAACAAPAPRTPQNVADHRSRDWSASITRETLDEGIAGYLEEYGAAAVHAAATPNKGADLAAAAQNPIASTISVPFENNFQFGADGGLQYVMNFQPVIPQSIGENWNLIHRPIVPVVYQSATIFGSPRPPPPGGDSEWGLSDTLYAGYFSPKKSGAWTWGIAPAIQIPTATSSRFGSQEWGLGASAVALQIKKPWLYGVLVTNVWSLESSASAFLLQPFVAYNFDGGWFLETGPQFTANWEAPDSRRWQIPLGGGVGKITKVGNQPLALRLHFYWNVERPENGPEALLRFTITFLFPKKS